VRAFARFFGAKAPTTNPESSLGQSAGVGVDYDRAAGRYAAHRRAHGGVLEQLAARCRPGRDFCLLEVGCGTGNYLSALAARFRCGAWGLDPSAGMLARARAHAPAVHWLQGQAERLPFVGRSLDLLFSVDLIHHVGDRAAFYRQAARVLRPGGWLCTATDSAEIIRRREILSGYFPETVVVELARYPRLAQLEAWMEEAGLGEITVRTVEAPYEITDAGPFRDRAYSSLHLITEAAWQAGLARLARDLARGPVRGVSRYACVWGRRPRGMRI
jgi:SAM-dependent methyltransferase